MAYLKNQTDTKITTENGGEQIQTTVKQFKIKTTPENFYNTFIESVGQILLIKSITQRHVLELLCKWADFNTGIVYLPKQRRDELAETICIPYHSVNNAISGLMKLKLIAGGKGKYTISPLVFWKGELKYRAEILKNDSLMVNFIFEDGNNDIPNRKYNKRIKKENVLEPNKDFEDGHEDI